MRTIKLFCVFFFGLSLYSSCAGSDDNADATLNNDIIIGEWIAIEQYVANSLVDLPIPLQCIYTTYTSDNRVFSDLISSENLPADCNTLVFEFGVTWTNIGNNEYRIGFPQEQGQVYTFYKDGENLVEEKPDGITRIVYQPYE